MPELCSLESVRGQACIYRHIATCVFTTIFINHCKMADWAILAPPTALNVGISGGHIFQCLISHTTTEEEA